MQKRSTVLAAIVAMLLSLAGALTGPATAAAATGATFMEQFDGPLDTSFWYVSDGYNNGAHQNCQFNKNNSEVANGLLSLSIDDTPYGDRQYSCGSIQTNQKYHYGTYETRMKTGKASGTNSSLFTYAGPYQGIPQSHEIDFETLGKDTTRTEVNSWVNGDPKGPGVVPLGLDNSTTWVNLGFVWLPGQLDFYVNGVHEYSFTGSDVPYEPQLILTMIWSTGTLTDWMGQFTYPGSPIVSQYDYVAFTKAGDPCQFATSVACGVEAPTTSFVDDFDRLDTGRWYVSNGWNNGAGQNCTWDAAQVSVASGRLNLSYTKKAVGDRQYACAEVQHRAKRGYGTYEVRMKGIAGSGLMASAFTYVGGTPSEATDIKLLGRDPSKVKFNTWRDGAPQGPVLVALPSAADAGFIDYGLKWTASRMDFYVDGQVVHTITDPAKIPDRETNLFLNLWGSENNPDMGTFVPPPGTVTFQVDRVAYTAPGDPCQFTGSIACA